MVDPAAYEKQLRNVVACHVILLGRSRNLVEMLSSSQSKKELFFNRLDELDELALENDDHLINDHMLKVAPYLSPRTLHRGRSPLDQDVSISQRKLSSSALTTVELGTSTPTSKSMKSAKISKRSLESDKIPPKPSKKPRNKKSLQLQPEDAQIFKGLTFCEITRGEHSHVPHLIDSRFCAQQRYCDGSKEAYPKGPRIWGCLGKGVVSSHHPCRR